MEENDYYGHDYVTCPVCDTPLLSDLSHTNDNGEDVHPSCCDICPVTHSDLLGIPCATCGHLFSDEDVSNIHFTSRGFPCHEKCCVNLECISIPKFFSLRFYCRNLIRKKEYLRSYYRTLDYTKILEIDL